MNNIFSITDLVYKDFLTYPNLEMNNGGMTFIAGESGCGKSTLLRLLNTTLSPSSGQILFEGKNVNELDTISYRRKVLLASQDLYLTDGTIRENFHFFEELREVSSLSDQEIQHFLSLCCISLPPDSKCSILSGGERQRIFLAICLSLAPQVLLLDEPTSALDSQTAFRLFDNLKQYCKEQFITPIVICHDSNLTNHFAEHIIELKRSILA